MGASGSIKVWQFGDQQKTRIVARYGIVHSVAVFPPQHCRRHPMAQRLKLTSFPSKMGLVAAIALHLKGLVHVDEATNDVVHISADDPNWPVDQQDYESLCSVVKETLAYRELFLVIITPVPAV